MFGVACCPRDGAPLISTMLFPEAEFYCLDCGGRFDFLQPRGKPETPELLEDMRARETEWNEHVQPRLRVVRAWLADCDQCKPGGEYHEAHATGEERAAHERALTWLRERRVGPYATA